jgi:2-iminobutanoate/2-iminopropanoate deaminase
MNFVSSDKAPAAVGPYSHAVVEGNLIFCAGQIGTDVSTDELAATFGDQVRNALSHIKNVVIAAGSSPDKIIRVGVYLTSLDNFPEMNKIYAEFFGDHKPARTTIQVAGLPKGALVEIDAIAAKS